MKTILVIEPDTILNENLVELLRLEGFQVKSATNELEAKIAMDDFKPSVIICDETSLTGEFGSLNNDLKKVHETGSSFIIIIDSTGEKFKEADAYIKMPFREEELLLKLETFTRAKRA